MPAATTSCAALTCVQRRPMPSSPCGQTSPSPTPTVHRFPSIPSTTLWATSRFRSRFTAQSLWVATSSSRPTSNTAFPLPGRSASRSSTTSTSLLSIRQSQLRQSVEGADQLNSPLYGCTSYFNGACQGGQSIQFINLIRPISGTNLVPRMSIGGELQVFLPIVNAPFRLYYAFNTLRLLRECSGRKPDHAQHVPRRRRGRLHLPKRHYGL